MSIFRTKDLFQKACQRYNDLHAMTAEERTMLQAHLRGMYLDIEAVCRRHDLQMMVAYGTVIGVFPIGIIILIMIWAFLKDVNLFY